MTFRIKVGDGFERLEPGMGRKPEKRHRPTKIAFGLAALVALGSLFGCAAVFAERETGIAVNTNPAGAEVLVDGQPREPPWGSFRSPRRTTASLSAKLATVRASVR